MAYSSLMLPRNQKRLRNAYNQRAAQNFAVPGAADDEVIAQIVAEDEARRKYGADAALQAEQFGSRLGLGQRGLGLAEKRLQYGTEATAANLAERKRQFDARLSAGKTEFDARTGLRNEAGDIAAKHNRYATGIGIANLGLSGLGAYADVKAADVEVAQMKEMQATNQDIAKMFIEHMKKLKG